MNVVSKKIFELFVLKLLWGPWNLLTGIIWIINDNVAKDVTFVRLTLGTAGTLCLVLGAVGVLTIPVDQTAAGAIAFSTFVLIVYTVIGFMLKATLSGRDEYIFSLP